MYPMLVFFFFNYSIRISAPFQRYFEPGFLELKIAPRTGRIGWYVLGQGGDLINYNTAELTLQPPPNEIRIYCEGSYIKQ